MIFIAREEAFTCSHCQAAVEPLGSGSYRNHCPKCLYSLHVDKAGPGDREASCEGLMKPVQIDQDGKKGWKILHQCETCGKEQWNKSAPDDEIIALAKQLSADHLKSA